ENAQDLLVGQVLANKYYVLSVLGFGGMSVVYKGKQIGKKRIVAVKTLRVQGLSDERTVKRFQREAELLSHLNHPRIVQVSHYGTTTRG
ncbi:protein kinase, partial [Acinetobacter baumannii]